MNTRFARAAMSLLTVAAVVLTVGQAWAVYFPLGPSKNEWGLKYEVQLSEAGGNTVNVALTLADEGRLGPAYSYTVVAFSPRPGGSQAYDLKSKIELQSRPDGLRAGQVQIRRDLVGKAMIRVLSLRFDGKPQTVGAVYYDIPLNRYTIAAAPAGTQPVVTPTTPTAAAAKPVNSIPSAETPSTIAPSTSESRGRRGRVF
jgi:hypothetical protein